MNKENNHIYCWFCGKSNQITRDTCFNCSTKLDPKEHPIWDYIKEQIGANANDGIVTIMIKLIKHYLYGSAITISIVFMTAAGVLNYMDKTPEPPKTNQRYQTGEVSDSALLVGCWKEIDDNKTYYVRINRDLTSEGIELVDNKSSKYTSYYSLTDFNEILDTDKYLYLVTYPDDVQGEPYVSYGQTEDYKSGFLVWKDDNHFSLYSIRSMDFNNNTVDALYTYAHERISCQDMPSVE